MKISRNDPCPCGSGKKVKKCCSGNGDIDDFDPPLPPTPQKEHFISKNVPIADDLPEFSKEYFKSVDTGELSTYALMNSCILRPELERLASKFTNAELGRGKKEAEVIKTCQSIPELVAASIISTMF